MILVVVGCGRSLGPDGDGDGLTDRQETEFGTNPANPDTDCDGIADGQDSQPLTGAILSLTKGPVTGPVGDALCAKLEIRLTVGGGTVLEGRTIELDSDLGEFDGIAEEGPGIYSTRLCTTDLGVAHVQASYDDPSDTCAAASSRAVLVFLDTLPPPGLNTADGDPLGIEGFLAVYALDAETPGLPFTEGAYVLVETGSGTFSGTTDKYGYIEWDQEAGLKGPADVTVAAEGFRTTTYFGVDAAIVAVNMVRLDPVPGVDDDRIGSVVGRVTGFDGKEGNTQVLDPFPQGGDIFDKLCIDDIPIAIVAVALRNVPLSSISMGNILESPDADESYGIPRPSNMYVHGHQIFERFRLDNLPEGQHLLFALGGTIRCLLLVMENPYSMSFQPRALGIKRIDVKAGKTIEEDIQMNINLLPDQETRVDVKLGHLPKDWKNGESLPNGLVFGVMDTGGEGYIFVAVDGAYNMDSFTNPITFRFPGSDEPHMQALGLETNNLAVGFGGRGTVKGADPPGIATAITPGVAPGVVIDYDFSDAWLPVPEPVFPKPPQSLGLTLDVLSEDQFTGLIEWKPVTQPVDADLYVVRVNYMTSAPRNTAIELPGDVLKGSVGGPRSHVLWELFVPGGRTSIELPVFPEDAPVRPELVNPVPNLGDKEAPQTYGPDTLEIELNVYRLGEGDKPFDYNDDFEYFDVNLHAADVSQDSYLVDFSNYPSTP